MISAQNATAINRTADDALILNSCAYACTRLFLRWKLQQASVVKQWFLDAFKYELPCRSFSLSRNEEEKPNTQSCRIESTRHDLNDRRVPLAGNSCRIIFVVVSLAALRILEKVGVETTFRRGICARKDESLYNPAALFLASICHALFPRFPGRMWHKICLAFCRHVRQLVRETFIDFPPEKLAREQDWDDVEI